MKKSLLFGLLALLMGGQAMAESQLCPVELQWGTYACISKIEINGMVSTSTTSPDGWEGVTKPAWGIEAEDFTDDESRVITLTPGQEYDLKVTVCNFSSGTGDKYHLSIYADWNNDYEIDNTEIISEEVLTLAAPSQNSLIIRNIKIKVPTSLSGNGTLRVYLHSDDNGTVPYTDPCSLQDGGQYEDYKMAFSGTSIKETTASALSVYPNPTDGILNINAEDASQYMLYSIDGKLVQKGIVEGNSINVAGNQPGMYILKVQSGDAVKQTNIIIK